MCCRLSGSNCATRSAGITYGLPVNRPESGQIAISVSETVQKGKEGLAGSFTILYEFDHRGPPLLNGADVGGVVAKTMQDDELLGLWRSAVDALAHPDWVRAVGIAVHHQQRRMAMRNGCDVVPLVGKRM